MLVDPTRIEGVALRFFAEVMGGLFVQTVRPGPALRLGPVESIMEKCIRNPDVQVRKGRGMRTVRGMIFGWGLLAVPMVVLPLVAEPRVAARPKVVLVELFTSEGCSSCPPADAILRQVNGTMTRAGQLIVGISEHVTYWNSLGWADPFSAEIFSARQGLYGSSFGLDGVYTPQMVVNGRHQFVGTDRGALEKAVRAEQDEAWPVDLRIVAADAEGESLKVTFTVVAAGSALAAGSAGGADIYAVIADDSDRSSVLRGENSGRDLVHVSVARSITRVSKVEARAGQQTVSIQLPPSFGGSRAGHHLILFAQKATGGRVLGADSRRI